MLDVPCCKVIAFGVLLEYGSSSKQGECDKDEVSCCEDQTIPDVNGEGIAGDKVFHDPEPHRYFVKGLPRDDGCHRNSA